MLESVVCLHGLMAAVQCHQMQTLLAVHAFWTRGSYTNADRIKLNKQNRWREGVYVRLARHIECDASSFARVALTGLSTRHDVARLGSPAVTVAEKSRQIFSSWTGGTLLTVDLQVGVVSQLAALYPVHMCI